ncbi:hypothetical protein CAOG_08336 [Capsaspora owczarzaki ATCC 30864]|uniref:hypothetical protein n=1 Tax=Capsaspora owczarzaki (strain ATCC 30864) TaxID=595528 RepID=UPI0001FE2C80|nr:hypothetical protein CAOG_08336 [Capsaspora owczarzaki ATCC 30864]|eukprot:XP_004340959.1 hypothetical protein CAOG_08336 [Capsaspora owczarzaki ATCC 30864]
MEVETEAAGLCCEWLRAVKDAPEKSKRDIAFAVALKLVFPPPVVLPGGTMYQPKGWTSRDVAARLAEAGSRCAHSTIHELTMKHLNSADWIRSSPLDQVVQLIRDSPKVGAPAIFTYDEMEQCIQMLEGFARAGQCLTQKKAGVYLVALSRLPQMSGAPRRQFTRSEPSRQWWKDFLHFCSGRLAIRQGRTLELSRIAAFQAQVLEARF